MTSQALLTAERIDVPIQALLESLGEVFRNEFPNDSGNQAFGVEVGGRRWFVKHADEPSRIEGLHRAWALNRAVSHRSLPALRNGFATPGGYALVYEWVPGEPLRGKAGARFGALPVAERAAAVEAVLDLHLRIAEAGFVAEDLYDGCFLYDFDARRTYVCDLDEYRAGPFVLDRDRTLGSTRFMAPEEWVRGATIDQVTNVFTLGRVAAILLGDRAGSPEGWRGPPALWAVVRRATQADRSARFDSVAALVRAWRDAAVREGGHR